MKEHKQTEYCLRLRERRAKILEKPAIRLKIKKKKRKVKRTFKKRKANPHASETP